ncbi:MAG: MFS transporter [Rhodospirillales bacterium 20-58-10]|nr:MAG: MFS transporter [Rhodospirillales bacterium 20-58-10]
MSTTTIAAPVKAGRTVAPVLGAVSFCHLLNDMMQSLLPAVYPILKGGFNLNFGEIGLLTLIYQITASLLQPMIGLYTDKKPQPYSLPVGMGFTLAGLVVLALAPRYLMLLAGAAMLGVGSSIFHPESSRIARLASGGRHGLAQSVFQVGGNFGQSLGPLLAAFFILPHGRASLAWFAFVALAAMGILSMLGHWYQSNGHARPQVGKLGAQTGLSAGQTKAAMAVLVMLMFSKFFYLSSITSYYIFYLMQRFGLSMQDAQVDLFIFLAASAAGVFIGGPVGDRVGRKAVIWGSILGVLPFTLVLPYVGLDATIVLSVIIGLVLSSAFSAIVVYAQELTPGRVGAVSGLFFGLAFGMGGIGAAVLGELADWTSIQFVYRVCAFLPMIGLAAAFLPSRAQIIGKIG